MKCPKCGYQRTKQDEQKPKSECPSCGVIYEKAQVAVLKQKAAKQKAKEEELKRREAELKKKEEALQDQTTSSVSNSGATSTPPNKTAPDQIKPDSQPPTIKNRLFSIINWVLGSYFFLMGLVTIPSSIVAAFCIFVVAALLIPLVRKFIGEKTGLTIPLPFRIITIIALIIASLLAHDYQIDKITAKKGGFSTVEEYKTASAKGYKSKEDYQKHLADQKAKKINELEKKLASTTGYLLRIDILKELVIIDSATYQSRLNEAQEQLKQHEAKIEAKNIARQQRIKEEEARELKERQEKTIGVWRDPRWKAKYTLLNAYEGFGELIIEFDDGSDKSTLVQFDKDIKGNLHFEELGNTRGEYYIIKSGILNIYDNKGFITSLLPDIGIPTR